MPHEAAEPPAGGATRHDVSAVTAGEYADRFDLSAFPETADDCRNWFDEWASVAVRELTTDDVDTERAVADHLGAAGAAVAACLDGQEIDRDDLIEQQRQLEAATR